MSAARILVYGLSNRSGAALHPNGDSVSRLPDLLLKPAPLKCVENDVQFVQFEPSNAYCACPFGLRQDNADFR